MTAPPPEGLTVAGRSLPAGSTVTHQATPTGGILTIRMPRTDPPPWLAQAMEDGVIWQPVDIQGAIDGVSVDGPHLVGAPVLTCTVGEVPVVDVELHGRLHHGTKGMSHG